MLEAVTTDLVFTISLKRSTQNLSTSWAGRLHHLSGSNPKPTAVRNNLAPPLPFLKGYDPV
jgi:hypothetical protein